jgi:molecular chaperone GrpE
LEEKEPQDVTAPVEAKPFKARKAEPRAGAEPGPDEKHAELEATLAEEKARADDYFRRLQYLQADFENYRKRVEKEMGEAKRFGNERLLSELLLVNDELELALRKAEESKQNPILIEGVQMVLKRVQGLLSKEGVQRIQSLGTKFTPDLHEAALQVPSDKEDGTIVEEIRAGYLLKGRVLRPSIVKVAEKQSTVETGTDKVGEA